MLFATFSIPQQHWPGFETQTKLSIYICSLLSYLEKNDSNVLSSDHEIISHVLMEELGKDTENPLPSIIHCSESPSSTANSLVKEPELSSVG